jgi:hypothetical protein
MNADRIPEAAEALLRECVYTFEELEILLLLHGDRERRWEIQDVAGGVRLSEGDAAAVCSALLARDLITEHRTGPRVAYAFGGSRPGIDEAMAALARVAADSRLTIIRIMNANAVDRLRTKAARAFSDAFLMRTRKDHG